MEQMIAKYQQPDHRDKQNGENYCKTSTTGSLSQKKWSESLQNIDNHINEPHTII